MSILSKLMDTMRFSPEEDEEYFGPDDDYEAEKPAKRGRFPAREESESYDVAFPSISTGAYHFPVNRAAEIAVSEIMEFLKKNDTIEKVLFVCHDERTEIVYHIAQDQYQTKR